jgi:hypothetical protein
VRVRANAGASSFRRRPRLQRFLAEAQEQVALLRQELDADPGASDRRQRAARERAARERQQRVERALEELRKVEARRARPTPGRVKSNPAQGGTAPPAEGGPGEQAAAGQKPKGEREPRASTPDPEARVMKGADGGFRPSYHVQRATDVETQCVVAVSVTHQGHDQGLLAPMLDRLRQRYGCCPPEMLADGAFATVDGIQAAAESHSVLYAAVKPPKNPRNDPYRPRRSDSPPVAEWRARMATRPRRLINNAPPPPVCVTRNSAIAASGHSWCAGWPRSKRSCSGRRSLITSRR